MFINESAGLMRMKVYLVERIDNVSYVCGVYSSRESATKAKELLETFSPEHKYFVVEEEVL